MKSTLDFFLKSFVPPVAFFVTFKLYGPKPAIAVAVVSAGLQLALQLTLRQKLSPFFLVASFFTIFFGGMDLVLKAPQYYRLAPFAENFVMGAVFGGTVLAGRPIVTWFAAALPDFVRPEITADMSGYLRNLTWTWAVYFWAKAGLFLYLAFSIDLAQLIIVRAVVGGGSMALLIGGEILYRTKVRTSQPHTPPPA